MNGGRIRNRIRSGFTLIEMMIVIAVILILSGIILRTTSLVLRNMAAGKAQHDLQQLQNALNEYYAEYGSYPPVDFVAYEYEGPTTRKNPVVRDFLADPQYNNVTNSTLFLRDVDLTTRPGWPDGMANKSIGYRYGLVSYLWPRDLGGQTHWYDKDQPRDIAAKTRWSGFLADVGRTGGTALRHLDIHGNVAYSNDVSTVQDPWWRDYQYVSKPPYQSYKLWSLGPDGINGTPDDINADSSYKK